MAYRINQQTPKIINNRFGVTLNQLATNTVAIINVVEENQHNYTISFNFGYAEMI